MKINEMNKLTVKNKDLMKTKNNKKIFLKALPGKNCHIQNTCDSVNVSRSTYYLWIRSDEDFVEAVNAIREKQIDDAECSLIKKINKGDITAIIFFLKTRGRHRGYSERVDIRAVREPSIEEAKEAAKQILFGY